MTGTDELQACEDNIIERVRHHLDRAHHDLADQELPFITVTYAQSLDGCIAQAEGETLQLSNRQSRRLTHQVRAIHDAILVGINTVLRDNPRLNVRLVEGQNPQPIVVDSRLRFPLDSCLLRAPCVRPIIFAGQEADADRENRLTDAGARVIRLPERGDGLLDLRQLFIQLKEMGFRSVMVEGGASIITSILTSHLANQVLLTIAPRFVGGLRAVKAQDGSRHNTMPRLRNMQFQWLAADLIIRGDLDRKHDESGNSLAPPATAQGKSPTLNISPTNGEAEKG